MGFKRILETTDLDFCDWATPQKVFDDLNAEFHFTLDPCASDKNHKCERYFTEEQDGLSKNWDGEIVFMNPPYGRSTKIWVEKASKIGGGGMVVALLPARTDTAWFHDYIYHKNEIRFIRGRLRYGDGKNTAPFGSMIVVFRNEVKSDE